MTTKTELELELDTALAKITKLEAQLKAQTAGLNSGKALKVEPVSVRARVEKRIESMVDKGNPAAMLLLAQTLQALAAAEKGTA